jgi:hypothetical protein
MARIRIHRIKEKNGNVTPHTVHVRKGDIVEWMPDPADKIDIRFSNGTPFDSDDLPGAFPGMSVGAIVTTDSGDFSYQVNTVHGTIIESEPQIIVDTGNRRSGTKKKKKKNGGKKTGKTGKKR